MKPPVCPSSQSRVTFSGLVSAMLALSLLLSLNTVRAGVLEGTATYRNAATPPADAVFEAVLQDSSRADAPAVTLGRSQALPPGQAPFAFQIAYDEATLQPGRRYTVRATIKRNNQLLFTTDRIYPVLDGRNQPLQIELVAVPARPQAARPPTAPPAQGLGPLPASWQGELPGASGGIQWHLDLQPEGRYQLRMSYNNRPDERPQDDIGRWSRDSYGRVVLRGGREAPILLQPVEDGKALRKLDIHGQVISSGHNDLLKRLPAPAPVEPQLLLTGMFSYMADAASITLCVDGQRLPVAMEGQYPALEAAYRQARPQPGQAVLVSLEGLIAARPSAEESRPARPTLIVKRFISAWPRETCGNTLAESPLHNTYWKLVRLGEQAVAAVAKQREAHLVLTAKAARVSGSGGCNRIQGGFTLEGEKLRFGRMAATMMACPDGMSQERQFFDALGRTAAYRISGSHLELLDEQGILLARFEAVALY